MFERYGVGSSMGSITHQEYVHAVEKAKGPTVYNKWCKCRVPAIEVLAYDETYQNSEFRETALKALINYYKDKQTQGNEPCPSCPNPPNANHDNELMLLDLSSNLAETAGAYLGNSKVKALGNAGGKLSNAISLYNYSQGKPTLMNTTKLVGPIAVGFGTGVGGWAAFGTSAILEGIDAAISKIAETMVQINDYADRAWRENGIHPGVLFFGR
ncbi:MAG: hypothetical protein KF763_19940 [Cyclobacteriaceae bacterium]|nr:hypothetical protein [Cyclobacteriaceae bacterium]